jgi:hypothetical protein
MNDWNSTTKTNIWTGTTETTWARRIEARDCDDVYLQIYVLNGRIYWTANVLIFGRPDLNRISHGMFADIPGALACAKGRATRIARDAVRASQKPRGAA